MTLATSANKKKDLQNGAHIPNVITFEFVSSLESLFRPASRSRGPCSADCIIIISGCQPALSLAFGDRHLNIGFQKKLKHSGVHVSLMKLVGLEWSVRGTWELASMQNVEHDLFQFTNTSPVQANQAASRALLKCLSHRRSYSRHLVNLT